MPVSEFVSTQRAVETEANLIQQDTLERLILAVQKAFSGWSTAAAINRHLVELANLELLTTSSLIHTVAVEFAELNAADKTKLVTQVNKALGPLGSIKESTKNMRTGGVNLISREFRRLSSQNLLDKDIQQALIGTRQAKFQDGLLSTISRSAGVNARTASKIGVEVGKEQAREQDPEIIGYQWVSTLDGRTSTVCMQLNGTKYYYNRSGFKPLPPAHPNCRSTTQPLYKNPSKNEPVETLQSWAKNNPKELKEAMGPGRYKLYTEGKLKIERFNDVAITPLTLKELKVKNAKAAERADLL